MARKHYTIYCDESQKKGRYFSNFYGGAIVKSSDREGIEKLLTDKKDELNLFGELKWTKITQNYQEKYIEFIKYFFDFVRSGRIKIRIMFSHNLNKPQKLSEENIQNEYFLLYYQFLKHSFGLQHSNPNQLDKVFISVLTDQIPDTLEKTNNFRDYVSKIHLTSPFNGKQVYFLRDQISDIKSHDHSILQALDIVLGSMNFRLNDHHKEKIQGKRRRGKRTIAKEKVYKEINKEIRLIYPNFNIGASTGTQNGDTDRWTHPYRHWCFVPRNHEIDISAVKPR